MEPFNAVLCKVSVQQEKTSYHLYKKSHKWWINVLILAKQKLRIFFQTLKLFPRFKSTLDIWTTLFELAQTYTDSPENSCCSFILAQTPEQKFTENHAPEEPCEWSLG